MAHKHSVYDTDNHFRIDDETRQISTESGNAVIMQFDHNSERFTFELPRKIDGHDMTQCDVIQVHYINIDAKTKDTSKDVYDVDDMQVSPNDEDVAILSWLIDGNATKYAGSLNFLIRFKCTTDGVVDYAWATAIYKGLIVSDGIDNGEAVVEEYSDILEQWREELFTTGGATDEQVANAVANYLEENPIEVDHPVTYLESLDTENRVAIRDLESGTYVLYGKFTPFTGSTSTFTFSSGMLVSVLRTDEISYAQIFYPKSNTIQYVEITDEAVTRHDAKLINMESVANMVTEIDESADDAHYPSAKAVKTLFDSLGAGGACHITRIESLEETGIRNLRELDSGIYILYGYFNAYPDAPNYMPFDNRLVTVEKQTAGSHLFVFQTLNARVDFHEILVDESQADGFTHTRTEIDLLAMHNNSGGNVDYVGVEPAEDDIPKVFLTGDAFSDMTTEKNEVQMGLEYTSKTDKFKAAIKIKFQGNHSLNYAKKNFTIKMYTDDTYETKLKKSFKDWNHSGNKYVLKANYIDHAHARNIVSANLWSQVVASRPDYDTLPEELRNSPRNGAIDGFPIKLYVNGTYQGIYTWNIGKDDWMWGMDEDNTNHVLMCAETNNNGATVNTPCNFRALWSGTDESNWTVEVGTNSTAVKTALNNLIQFVMDNDGDDFRNGIGNYLDIQSAIDYYIFMYDICGLDGLAKNMLLATYDGTKWICGAYDLDATFGLFYNGSKFVSAEYACPENYQETYSLLWERIEANFVDELKARQAELRASVLSYANTVTHFERFMDIIGLDLYAEDLTIYTGIPSGSTNNIKQIRNYIRDRQAYVDAEFAAMSVPVPCTGISLSASELTFTAEGTQTLTATLTPDGCSDPITWESDNASIATVDNGVVTAIANGSATITAKCGEFSASCSVSVSGLAEPVPCTGITLDKTELTFDGEGSQTITATVTPSDTTDTVVWVSSNPSVASITVEDNVCTIQSVGNGDAVITVTCGEYSASCNVTVSGFENVLTWKYGYISAAGELVDLTEANNNGDMYCEFPVISGETYILWNENDEFAAVPRMLFYDVNGDVVSSLTSSSSGNCRERDWYYFTVPDGAVYATLNSRNMASCYQTAHICTLDELPNPEYAFADTEWVPGGISNTGAFAPVTDPQRRTGLISVEEGATYTFANSNAEWPGGWIGAGFYDNIAMMNGSRQTGNGTTFTFTVPAGKKYIALSAHNMADYYTTATFEKVS